MGRYYTTEHFSGKFGFAVQPSYDPEYFGMEEYSPNEIHYYLEGSVENIKAVTELLDLQYDICELPKEKRVYYVADDNVLYDFVETVLDPVVYREYDPEIDDGAAVYGGFEPDWLAEHGFSSGHLVTKTEAMQLAMFRIRLGLRILSDLKDRSECILVAEV